MDIEKLKNLWLSNMEDNQTLLLNILSSEGITEEELLEVLRSIVLSDENIKLKSNVAEKLSDLIATKANKIYIKRILKRK